MLLEKLLAKPLSIFSDLVGQILLLQPRDPTVVTRAREMNEQIFSVVSTDLCDVHLL